jgi:hypothetical protein
MRGERCTLIISSKVSDPLANLRFRVFTFSSSFLRLTTSHSNFSLCFSFSSSYFFRVSIVILLSSKQILSLLFSSRKSLSSRASSKVSDA